MAREWPSSRALRKWQERAFRRLSVSTKTDFMCVACPGSGKTTFALRGASEALNSGRARRMAVVCPTEHLKVQWAEAATAVGISLNPFWSNGSCAPARDFDGVAMTYAQVAANPAVARMLCREPTFVILDEIHHAGDEASWGRALVEAFGMATRRLLLSGTPFRSTGLIPFVEYTDAGELVTDFAYGYGDALADPEGVCRPIFFPTYEGKMEWYNKGQKYVKTFEDQANEADASKRLRTALLPGGDWVREVILDADRRLTEIRTTHSNAAGLIVAMDIGHAKALAARLNELTGERAVIVHSDDPESSQKIKAFRDGTTRWIIAVKMVSEGVDIPRLRVGIYATNTTTELFFRQVLGRFVRSTLGLEDQNAYLLIPRDRVFVDMVQDIQRTRLDVLKQETRDSVGDGGGDDKVVSTFVPISATGEAHDVFHPDGVSISQDEVRAAQEVISRAGAPCCYDPSIVARLFRVRDGMPIQVAASTPTEAGEKPLHEQKKDLAKVIKKYVYQIVEMSDGSRSYEDVYAELKKRDGLSQPQCTISQLKARIQYLMSWQQRLSDG